MIVDTSAVLAVLFDEPDAERYATALASVAHNRMSVANYLEAAIVIEGRAGEEGGHHLDALVERAPIELVEVTADHATAARRAWRRFGRGKHPAGLNFGDCFAYALADTSGEPLLFKGSDFALTGPGCARGGVPGGVWVAEGAVVDGLEQHHHVGAGEVG